MTLLLNSVFQQLLFFGEILFWSKSLQFDKFLWAVFRQCNTWFFLYLWLSSNWG